MSAILIDTETTGLHEPRPVQIAYTEPLEIPAMLWQYAPTTTCSMWNPLKEIELAAMATHLIHPEDLSEFPPYYDFKLPPVEYLVAHNVDYDWEALGRPAVKRICTMALARRVWEELPSHNLRVLAYHVMGRARARGFVKTAHGAATDLLMLSEVFQALMQAPFLAECGTWEQVWERSEEARVPVRMDFGKHGPKPEEGKAKGMLITEMRRVDPGYLQWLLSGKCEQVNNNPYLRKALTR